jgi:hypothetical protein
MRRQRRTMIAIVDIILTLGKHVEAPVGDDCEGAATERHGICQGIYQSCFGYFDYDPEECWDDVKGPYTITLKKRWAVA